ncbi:T9SS type A sorting domain-containing protein [Reichenbachiella ulvae]|uniref:T9SS type A sorting domain-containing protein n=1 Tax=Reichenbachiella ulvae TaxID=2980104 RepID=A0ABT3CWE7_9BACT|nr:T9SS type A sorting domain-containing protein [Reichenbachiella ulvae]MCV9387859.1 T9SS type A sorting domain-containing protein [Reichenbachiella ulvae]
MKSFFSTLHILLLCAFASVAQDYSIIQNTTGNSGSSIRGQKFNTSILGEGTGTPDESDKVYLTSFDLVYSTSGNEAPTLYIYSALPSDITSTDDGSGGTLVGQSTAVVDGVFPFTRYEFDYLPLSVGGNYYAVFRKDVDLEFGGSANVEGPYAGGKMLKNDAGALVENDFTDIRFKAEFYNEAPANTADVAVLKELYESTDGSNWTNTWDLEADPLTWYGVGWTEGRVTGINLSDNGLVGTIPASMAQLGELTSFNMRLNELTGSIPEEIGQLTKMHGINLSYNQLSGSIPGSIYDLSGMVVLSLEHNELEGSIPGSFTQLSSMEICRLSHNKLSGALPAGIAEMPVLATFDLSYNDFGFGSFENWVPNASIASLKYLPQNRIEREEIAFVGEPYTLSVTVSGENNLYEWKRNAVSLNTPSSNPDLTIENIEAGDYYCYITNSLIGDGSYISAQIHIVPNIDFSTEPNVTDESAYTVDVDFYTSGSGDYYYVLLNAGSEVPDPQQIQEGLDATGNAAWMSGSAALASGYNQINLVNLDPATQYEMFVLLMDSEMKSQKIARLTITTEDRIRFEEGFPQIQDIGQDYIQISSQTNRMGQLYMVGLEGGSTSPTAEQVKLGLDASDEVASVQLSGELLVGQSLLLTAEELEHGTAFDFYLVAEDEDGYLSEVGMLSVETILNSARPLLEYTVYPNPLVGTNMHFEGKEEFVHYSILDDQGRIIIDGEKSSKQKFDLSDLSPGVYLLQIHDQEKKMTFRVIKK